jgi:hypothetical protein
LRKYNKNQKCYDGDNIIKKTGNMKKILCSGIGGPAECTEVITGATAEEMIDKGWKHIQEAHPELAQNIMNNPKEENDKWMANFKAKFDTLEDA